MYQTDTARQPAGADRQPPSGSRPAAPVFNNLPGSPRSARRDAPNYSAEADEWVMVDAEEGDADGDESNYSTYVHIW